MSSGGGAWPSRTFVFAALGAVVIATALLHRGALDAEFYWDDRTLILENLMLRDWKQAPEMFRHELYHGVVLDRTRGVASVDTYRPLYNLSFLVDWQLWGPNPHGFHVTNLAIHLANVVLLFLFLGCFLAPPGALFGAALFAFHPLACEPVHYTSARADSLLLFFALLSGWWGFRKARFAGWEMVLLGAFLLAAALVKEVGVFVPLFLVLVSWGKGRRSKSLLFLAVAVYVTYFFLRAQALSGMKAVQDSRHLAEILWNFPSFVGEFCRQALVPEAKMPMQAFLVDRAGGWGLGMFTTGAVWLLFGALILGTAAGRVPPGPSWILLSLLPSFFATSLTGIMNPRYFYPALPGLASLLAGALGSARMGSAVRATAMVLIPAAFAWATATATADYQTGARFYAAVLRGNPHHVEAEYSLANAYHREGRYAEAATMYREVLRHNPRHASAHNNLGSTLLKLGNPRQAALEFRKALEILPGDLRYTRNFERARALLQPRSK